MKNEKIISLYVSKEEFYEGQYDVTEKLYKIIPKDDIEGIKYMVPSSTEAGIYFTLVIFLKKEKNKGGVGY